MAYQTQAPPRPTLYTHTQKVVTNPSTTLPYFPTLNIPNMMEHEKWVESTFREGQVPPPLAIHLHTPMFSPPLTEKPRYLFVSATPQNGSKGSQQQSSQQQSSQQQKRGK